MIHSWAKDNIKHYGYNVELIYTYLSGSGRKGKSHFVIYHTISKTLLYHCKDTEKP